MLLKPKSLYGPLAITAVLAAIGSLSIASPGAAASTATDVGAATSVAQVSSSPAQSIQNIGASGAWWVNDLVHFSPAIRQQVAQLLFSPSGVQILATSLGGKWTLVVNNLNNSAQTVNVHLPTSSVSASGAYRTSASENLSPIALPAVSGGTASLSLSAHSITTYVFG